ncbi:MAG: ABC transporter permease [Bryobacteraceae bacterium]
MTRDLWTMVWKEWKEIFLQRGTLRGGVFTAIAIPLGLLGIFIPWQEGPRWAQSSTNSVVWIWLPVFLVATMICESFAGERERKTLETLLASRLDDRTILFGKLAAAVGYGWGLAMSSLVLGLITVNVVHSHGPLITLPAATVLLVAAFSLLASTLAASAGVLISLRASTVRQAQQTLSLSLLGLMFGGLFGIQALPAAWKIWLARTLSGATLLTTELLGGALLLALDLLVISIAVARFQRARLILD